MSEKYYVVSEEELDRLHSTAFAEGVVFCGEENGDDSTYDYERFKSDDNSNLSMAACRAREVPEWAKYFVDDYPPHGFNTEEIKR